MKTSSQRRFRPGVERLEGRDVPANFTAASASDLIAAINAANTNGDEDPGPDTMTLTPGVTFTLTAADNTTDGPTGLPVVAAGEELTVVGNGDVIERSTAAGTPAFRLLDVAAGGTLRLQDLTLQGGLALGVPASGAPAWSQGGAVFNRGTLGLSGVIVQSNAARGADGGQPWASPPQGGAAAGGGLYSADGALTLAGSTLRSNLAIGGHGTQGGFVAADLGSGYAGFRGGDAAGGGLYVGGGTALISDCALTANTARGGDGGDGASLPKGVDNLNPTAGGDGGDGSGGAIYAAAGSLTVRSTEITSNLAQGGAGGAGGTKGSRHAPDGASGLGVGGAIYIVNPDAAVSLDNFTLKHLRRNKSSTMDGNIHGTYSLIA